MCVAMSLIVPQIYTKKHSIANILIIIFVITLFFNYYGFSVSPQHVKDRLSYMAAHGYAERRRVVGRRASIPGEDGDRKNGYIVELVRPVVLEFGAGVVPSHGPPVLHAPAVHPVADDPHPAGGRETSASLAAFLGYLSSLFHRRDIVSYWLSLHGG